MKPRIRRFGVGGLAALITLATLSGCTGTTEPVALVRILPASQTVMLQSTPQGPTLSTSVTLTNTSALPIIWSNCAIELERNIGIVALFPNEEAGWEVVWSPICPLVLLPLTPLQPGESVVVPVTAIASPQYPGTFSGEPGEYRIRFYLSAVIAGEHRQLPRAASSSGSFTVVAQ